MPILEPSRQVPPLPAWREVRQSLPHHALPSVAAAVEAELARPEIRARIEPGARVAIGVGSRGINNLAETVRALVGALRTLGAQPFIVPAMGSHGGSTATGQVELLAGYGITADRVGAPIRASMETVELGEVLGGIKVYIDRIAHTEADAIVPVARVKPHTEFRGEIESGLHKMMAIGLGKHQGASSLHTFPMERFGELLRPAVELILAKAAIPFGLALVEDAYEDTAIVEAVPSEAFFIRERELLVRARAWLPGLPFSQVDVLIIQKIGKNISGAGMDPNVTGRSSQPSLPRHVQIGRLLVLDLTDESHGNAAGIGMADVTTRRAARKIDWPATYTNIVAAGILEGAKLPLVAESDREALAIALQTLSGVNPATARIAWIKNTLAVQRLWVSDPLWPEIRARGDVETIGEPESMRFDEGGSLLVGPNSRVGN